MQRNELLDLYFMDARAKLIDLGAFLDRVERGTGDADFRLAAFRSALQVLAGGEPTRARDVLMALSDPTSEPIEKAPGKGAVGAWGRIGTAPKNHRMKNHIVGLYTAIYHVADLATAKKWYAEFLGQAPYFDEPFYVGFNVAGNELGLLPRDAAAERPPGVVAYWGVRDIAQACAKLEGQGHRLREPIAEVGEGIKVASLADPDGNLIGLIENPHFPNTCQS